MNAAKKAEERRLVDHFVAAWSDREIIARIDGDGHEAPDFVGEMADGRRFGLEVVTLTADDVKRSESILDRFKDELRLAGRATSTFANFVINIEEHGIARLWDRGHRNTLIERLLRFARLIPRRPKEIYGRKLEGRGISGIGRLAVYPTASTVEVTTSRSVWGRPALVYDRIEDKDRKVLSYRSRLPVGAELWLLLVGGTELASSVSAPMHEPIATQFDRVFFLDLWPVRAGKEVGRVVEIRKASAGADPG
jgi:hypothetical protein